MLWKIVRKRPQNFTPLSNHKFSTIRTILECMVVPAPVQELFLWPRWWNTMISFIVVLIDNIIFYSNPALLQYSKGFIFSEKGFVPCLATIEQLFVQFVCFRRSQCRVYEGAELIKLSKPAVGEGWAACLRTFPMTLQKCNRVALRAKKEGS